MDPHFYNKQNTFSFIKLSDIFFLWLVSEENSSSESNWKKIYGQSEPPSKRSVGNHQSAFGKSSRFNPFFKRTLNDNVADNTVVVSR